jgi:copper resistance protein B
MRLAIAFISAVMVCGLPTAVLGQQSDQQAPHQHPDAAAAPASNARPITDADRAAAFPDVGDHAAHRGSMHVLVLFDELEWRRGGGEDGAAWDGGGWVGRDRDRIWLRTTGVSDGDGLDRAEVQVLYGRAFSRWWDVVAGVRQDAGDEPPQTWAAVGLQGLAPYWFDVRATAFVGSSGQTHVRFETEYELLITNRLILRPLVEVDIHGKSDPERGIGAGLSSAEAGLRLRYELRRELAPYVGVVWTRRFFGTADYAQAGGRQARDARLALGLRLWF